VQIWAVVRWHHVQKQANILVQSVEYGVILLSVSIKASIASMKSLDTNTIQFWLIAF
jgi:hypothetical protein